MNLADITEEPDHQKKIAIDTVKNPSKWLLGGPDAEEAEKVLKDRYGYTDEMIAKLKEEKLEVDETKEYVLVHDKKIIAKGTKDEMRDKGNAMRKDHGAVSDLFIGFYDVEGPDKAYDPDKFKIGAVWEDTQLEDSESVWRGVDMDDTLYKIIMKYWDSLPNNMQEELKAVLDESCGKPHKKRTHEGYDSDESIADEVLLIARNDASWYKRQYVPIIKNLMRKRAKGIYDHELAKKLWRYYIDNIVKSHTADLGPSRGIPGTIRNMAASELADFEKGEMDLGNWDNILKEGKMKDLSLDLEALSDEEFEDKWQTKKSDWDEVKDKSLRMDPNKKAYISKMQSAESAGYAEDGPAINQMTDEDLAEYLGVDVELVKKDRESAEDAAYDKTADMVGETGGLLSEYDLDPTDLDDYREKMKTLRGLEQYMGTDPELDQAIKHRYANLAKWKMAVGEEAPNPYAIGMSKAMKMTGDKPPLKKKTINKAHKIAKAIMKDSKMDKKQVNENVQITSINNAGEGVVEGESGAELHVIAQGEKDVAVLADLLKLSGLRSSGLKAVTPQDCGIAEDEADEDIERGHWPSNAPEPKTVDAETQTVKMSGGLNGPKDKRHLRGDSNFLRPDIKKEEIEESLWDLYKEFKIEESTEEK
jgi:hypothetical protein